MHSASGVDGTPASPTGPQSRPGGPARADGVTRTDGGAGPDGRARVDVGRRVSGVYGLPGPLRSTEVSGAEMDTAQIERCHRLIEVHRGAPCPMCNSRRTWPNLVGSAGERLFLCTVCDECGHIEGTPWAPPPR